MILSSFVRCLPVTSCLCDADSSLSPWASKHRHLPVRRGVVGEEVDYRLHSRDASFSFHATTIQLLSPVCLHTYMFFFLFSYLVDQTPPPCTCSCVCWVLIVLPRVIFQDLLNTLKQNCRLQIWFPKYKIYEHRRPVCHVFSSLLWALSCVVW